MSHQTTKICVTVPEGHIWQQTAGILYFPLLNWFQQVENHIFEFWHSGLLNFPSYRLPQLFLFWLQ